MIVGYILSAQERRGPPFGGLRHRGAVRVGVQASRRMSLRGRLRKETDNRAAVFRLHKWLAGLESTRSSYNGWEAYRVKEATSTATQAMRSIGCLDSMLEDTAIA